MKTFFKKINGKKVWLFVLLMLVCCQFFVPEVGAVTSIDNLNQEIDHQTPPQPRSTNLWLDTLKLVVILALIVAAAWFIIKLFSKQAQHKMQGRFLHVADEVLLGQNRGIILCSVGAKMYALGVTDHNISVLFEVEDADLIKQILELEVHDAQQPNPGGHTAYENILKRWKKYVNGRGYKKRPVQQDFHELMEGQLQRLKGISGKDGIDTDQKGRNDGSNP